MSKFPTIKEWYSKVETLKAGESFEDNGNIYYIIEYFTGSRQKEAVVGPGLKTPISFDTAKSNGIKVPVTLKLDLTMTKKASHVLFYHKSGNDNKFFILAQTGPGKYQFIGLYDRDWNRAQDRDEEMEASSHEFTYNNLKALSDFYKMDEWVVIENPKKLLAELING